VGCVPFDRTKNLIIVNMAIEGPDGGRITLFLSVSYDGTFLFMLFTI